jgi:phosphoglycerate-specific signal transduction histidine kinase
MKVDHSALRPLFAAGPTPALDHAAVETAQLLVRELFHDLRQPLTSMNMNLQTAVRLLRSETPQRDAAVEALSDCLSVELDVVQMLSRSLQRFAALMNPSLPVPLNEVVRDVVATVCTFEANWQKRLLVHLTEPSPLIPGEARRLRLALVGFVRRALIQLDEQRCVVPLTLETGTGHGQAEIVVRCFRGPVFEPSMEGLIDFVEALTRRVGGTVTFDARDTEAIIVISLPTATGQDHSATGGTDGN